ncbi:hypothetical protein GCM10007242_16830 [Pigmentiphaga litoralis]|uniref:hypothetical protein n=1 Tax=Pigmentiphaga litoralis TaxID=516702 RepID=UPI00167BD07A|nr:hypothetical protein [Pigmentiphaga litoralis]GGX11353.1 hypothetical protein GCM10007242_16830 [Pigmentiphaga litoralis]
MTTYIAIFFMAEMLGLIAAMGLGRAAAHADREFAAEAIAQGRPDIAAIYLEGCAA